LYCPVHHDARVRGVAAAAVVDVTDAVAFRRRHDQQRDLSGAKRARTSAVVERPHHQRRILLQRLDDARAGGSGADDADLDPVGTALAEGDAQSRREKNREDEGPEHCLRLADELAEPDQRQLSH